MLLGRYLCVLGIVCTLWGCRGPDLVSNDELRGQDIHPYVGLIRNFSNMNISIPSHDSSATLILPARGQMEYTVWQPNVDIFGFVDGKQVYFKNIRIKPNKKFYYFGNSYDFMAEVCPDITPPMVIPQQCPQQCPVGPEPKLRPPERTPKRVCPG
jgi:hypothetical protein